MTGANRVVIGLPERYEKAKREIARFEAHEKAIRDHIDQNPIPDSGIIELILDGAFDDDLAA